MASTLDDGIAERQIAEELSNLERAAEVSPSDQPTTMETSRAQPATNHQLAKRRYVAFICSLLAASGVAAWWWSSSAHPAMTAPSDPAATLSPREAAGPKDASQSAIALVSDLAQQFQSMTRDLTALRQAAEQLKVTQEQLVNDNANVASQLKASQEETARNKGIVDEIKAMQIQMRRESQTLIDRINASQEQLARITANASAPNVIEETRSIPQEPRVVPEVPLPRPRQPANVAQAPKPAPTPARPQPKKPQSSLSWPWPR